MTPAILVLNNAGNAVARQISRLLDGERHVLQGRGLDGDVTFADTGAHLRQLFVQGRPIVGICATGILVRLLAPLLADKLAEPPVIAVSPSGGSVVPVLGGHHGANEMSRRIASALGGIAAVTTAGDDLFDAALDEPPATHKLANPDDAKAFMSALLAGQSTRLSGPMDFLGAHDLPADDGADLELAETLQPLEPNPRRLVYHPQQIVVGVGCIRGAPAAAIEEQIRAALAKAEISPHAVAALVSIDIKADESGLHQAANNLGVPVRFFSAAEINAVADRLPNPSDVVLAEVGVPGVAEGAALAASGISGRLLLEKQKTAQATVAISMLPAPVDRATFGRDAGRLYVIGTGPGTAGWRTAASEQALRAATDWVGYGLYLDLADDLSRGKQMHRFDLGAEELRVRHALDLAGQGKTVALVCSGDPGIYAMATLVYEVLAIEGDGAISDAARRVDVIVEPGISAFQACAARAGAPIGHDFCTISLSDLLTPWADIERRLHAAAEADFVVSFYNPRSRKRDTHLARALEILAQHRPPDTPVICGYNLGRETESVTVTPLAEFNPEVVDMLTLVMVGSSASRPLKRGSGTTNVYTPRGYEKKRMDIQ